MVAAMSTNLVNVDRDTPLLLPLDMREWVPEDDLLNFVVPAITGMKLPELRVNPRGTGSPQYPPKMMLMLLVYCYAQRTFSSRRIEAATYRDLGVRSLTGDTHPDHDTICAFRRQNQEAIAQAFLEVLRLAREMGLLKVGTISVDGTHIKANASKHKNVSYQRAVELEEQLKLDIAELLQKAESDDRQGAADPAQLPPEVSRRQDLLERMALAKASLEERAKREAAAQRAEYEAKLKARQERIERDGGPGPGGGNLKAPDDNPKPQAKDQVNLTDADSRLMKKNHSAECTQSYNAQAAVDADGSMLVVATGLTQCANDSGQLEPMVRAVPQELGVVKRVLADTGYVNKEAMERLEKERKVEGGPPEGPPEVLEGPGLPGVELYVAVGREDNQRRYDYRPRSVTQKPVREPTDPYLLAMKEKLKTQEGRRIYAKRKQTVEPVFGVIKQAMGFRQFLLRGMEKVRSEWKLVCLAYNLKRMHSLIRESRTA